MAIRAIPHESTILSNDRGSRLAAYLKLRILRWIKSREPHSRGNFADLPDQAIIMGRPSGRYKSRVGGYAFVHYFLSAGACIARDYLND